MNSIEIKELLRIGVNVDLSGFESIFTMSELKEFARIVDTIQDSHLTISSNGLAMGQLKELARIGRSRLTIVVVDN